MQTLNVAAGRTDAEYKAAEEQRRADLRADSLNAANYFFWAAVLGVLGSGILFVRLGFLVNIGVVDLIAIYGRSLGSIYPVVALAVAVLWVLTLVALGLAARLGYRLAFLVGIVLYSIDMLALIVTFSVWAFGVHAFFVYKWFQGQKALRDASEPDAQLASTAGAP